MARWSDECPARGAGLEHAHWSKCDPMKGGHPQDGSSMVGQQHPWNVCCHCRLLIHAEPDSPAAQVVEAPPDHAFVAGPLNGSCGRRDCRAPASMHPTAVRPAAIVGSIVEGVCTVDHASISTKLLINDGGLEWTRCPICDTMVEPRFPSIGAQGRPYDPGRGDLTERLKKRLTGWAGWVWFNGGD